MTVNMQKSILKKILATLARMTIKKYRPVIVGITGSVGKTSTREAIFAVLKKKYRVRTAEKNYNTEIGLPLTILGIPHYGKNILGWLYGLIRANKRIVFGELYPEILVLEYGIDRPGDMDRLLSIARPNIAVVTAIGDIPVHVEFFKNPEEVIAEKAKLVAVIPEDGQVILNRDDYAVYDMKDKTKAKIMTFGFEEHAEVKIINYQLSAVKNLKFDEIPDGITFKIEHQGYFVPFRLHGAFGEPQAYAVAAAAAVGLALGINLVDISEAIKIYNPPAGRMKLLRGIMSSFILDDTYNAAPEAMRSALNTLKNLSAKRKIAVLGDMLEIGKYAEQAHRAIGDQTADFVDLLVTVGPRAKFIADAAQELERASPDEIGREATVRSPEEKVLSKDQVLRFENAVEAGEALARIISSGDLILVKGSQSMRMEKVIEKIMAEPQRRAELLVRQEGYWKIK
jgi:UDP-N-acetylmuramoyl-tripeptide--D-alanyl-D-alanine ligase